MATTPLPFPQEGPGSVGPAAPLPPGTMIAHLCIERVLHEGPHSTVYLARDPDGAALALKEFFPRSLALRQPDGTLRARQAGDAISMSVGREAFVAESNTLGRLDHPGLVRVVGSLQVHRTIYRAMHYVDGPTLEQFVARRSVQPSVLAVTRFLDGLLDVLGALHRAGVVHACVRPDQILIRPDGRPVLLGMASASAEIAGHEPGPWTPPEQSALSRHDRTNSATDLYMAAATTWFFATGHPPPDLRDRLSRPDAWQPAVALVSMVDEPGTPTGSLRRLSDALTLALALRPADRPQRVSELQQMLHPGSVQPTFEASGTAPLWVGTIPDRDSQWQVLGKEEGERRPDGPSGDGPIGLASKPDPMSQPGASDLGVPGADPPSKPTRPSRRRWQLWTVAAGVFLVVSLILVWAYARNPGFDPALRLGQLATPTATPAPADAAGASPGSPTAVCANQPRPELIRCMQQQCDEAHWRDHFQCVNLRRQGDIQ